MAAKLLHSLADDNPDMHKQIGCMAGIFHLFDRHNMITTKRITHKRFPPGHSQSNCGNIVSAVHHQEKAKESSLNENVYEKHSVPAESSRDSLSSCSSSLSSLECIKTAQPEASSFSRIDILESPPMGSALDRSNTSSYSEKQSFNLKNVVKDSMHREVRTSFVKMNDMDDFDHGVKYRDSPRPLRMSKCVEASPRVARNEKEDIPIHIEESLRVLAKLRDASWNFNEATGLPRSSCENEAKLGKNSISRDSPRLSYDGRERSQFSLESRNIKSSPRLKELPRLSLDSRENFTSVSVRTHISRNSRNSSFPTDETLELQHFSGNKKRLPSVVAKLMGLETLPDSISATDTQFGGESFAESLESRNLKMSFQTSASDKRSSKCSTSPRQKNPDLITKPIPSSRLPIETAPWRKLDGTQASKKAAFRPVKGRAPNSSSAYGEAGKKLKDLESEQSSKDLRALKQILEAIQIRALSEIGMEEQASDFGTQRNQEPKSSNPNRKTRLTSQRNKQSSVVATSSAASVPRSSKAYESPIVIIRPTRPVEKSGILLDRIPGLHKLQNEGFQRCSSNGQIRTRSPKNSQKDSAAITSEKLISRNIRSPQTSSKPQLAPKESTTSSIKSSDSVSPRLRSRRVEVEKRSAPQKSDTNKPKRKMKQTDSNCHCEKTKTKSSNTRQCDDQSSEMSNESRALSYQSDDMTQQSDTNLSSVSKIDIEVRSSMQSTEIDGSQSRAMEEAAEFLTTGSVKKLSMVTSSEDGSTINQDTIALEHPSPVSVLDASLYRDDEASPVKQITTSLKGDDSLDSNDGHSEDQSNVADEIFLNTHNVEIDSMKFENIEDLIQKIRRLNSHHDEAEMDYMASLCDDTNPDHIYISEILLASGLLLRDLGSGMTMFRLHPSGNPISPELFCILEKTKARGLPLKEGFSPAIASHSNREKFHRKLIFDVVNEILVEKLALTDDGAPEPWLKPTKIAERTLTGQKILKQLCHEIEQFQAKKFKCSFDEEKDDSKSILQDDVTRQSGSWTEFCGREIYDVVLDVERLIFKDLVNEIVIR